MDHPHVRGYWDLCTKVKRKAPRLPMYPGASFTTFEPWLPIVNDVRTALVEDPLPCEMVKELLEEP